MFVGHSAAIPQAKTRGAKKPPIVPREASKSGGGGERQASMGGRGGGGGRGAAWSPARSSTITDEQEVGGAENDLYMRIVR